MRDRVRVSKPTPASAPLKPVFLGFRVFFVFPMRTCSRQHTRKLAGRSMNFQRKARFDASARVPKKSTIPRGGVRMPAGEFVRSSPLVALSDPGD